MWCAKQVVGNQGMPLTMLAGGLSVETRGGRQDQPMARSSKRNRRRLPRAPTGCRNGQCFIAALLAHVGENDLERSAVPDRAIEKVRQKLRAGKRRREYLDGEEQSDVAVALGLSYITVERGSRTANVYKYGCGAVEEQQYAMLVQDKPRHTEPLPTGGGRKCGGIELNERGGFGGDFTGTDSDGADAGVAADDDIGTLRACMRKRRRKEAPESSAGQEPEIIELTVWTMG